MSKTNEDDIFVIGYRDVEINGKVQKVPTYGSFCPKCKTSSDNIHGYGGKLLRCILCDYTFSGADVVRKIDEFWIKKEMKN